MSISYFVGIDTANDGSFTDFDDVISDKVLELRWRLGMSKSYERVSDVSSAELLLRSYFQEFSPEYVGSFIGKRLIIQSDDGTSLRTHFIGTISAFEPEAGLYGKRRTRVLVQGREAELKEQIVRLPMMLEFSADEAVQRILRQVKWRYDVLFGMCIIDHSWVDGSIIFPDDAFAQNLDTGKSVFPYLGDDWAEGLPADKAIEQLMIAEGGRFFFNREGEAVFYNRHHLLQEGEIVAAFEDAMDGIRYRHGGEILNEVEVQIRPRSLGNPDSLLWSLANPIRLKPGVIIRLTSPYKLEGFPVGAMTVHAPQRYEDFAAFLREEGLGFEMSREVQVALLEAGASSAVLEIRNRSRHTVYLTRLEIYGTPLIAGDPVSVTSHDMWSRTFHGTGRLMLNVPILADTEEAEAIAQWEIVRRKLPRGIVRELSTSTRHHPLETLSLSLFDRIRISELQTGHDGIYHILGESHHVEKGGTVHHVSWIVEPAESRQFFVIGTDSIGDSVVLVPR
jgi:hypothetical protein